jgi:hypothetical protein
MSRPGGLAWIGTGLLVQALVFLAFTFLSPRVILWEGIAAAIVSAAFGVVFRKVDTWLRQDDRDS